MLQQPPLFLRRLIAYIDRINLVLGYAFCLLLIPLILCNVIEVIMRYGFDKPTIWAFDTTTMSFGSFFMLGSAYTLLVGAHVRTDMFWDKFSDRTKGIIDFLSYILLFMPAIAILFSIAYDDFIYSIEINERSNAGIWRPVVWPLRGAFALATFLLMLQGISEIIKTGWAALTGKPLVKHEKIEV